MSGNKQDKIDSFEKKFNTVMLGMLGYVNEYYPRSEGERAKDLLEIIIKTKQDLPIACFLQCIYRNDGIRRNILDGNDDFFMDNEINMEEHDEYNIEKFKNDNLEILSGQCEMLDSNIKNTIGNIAHGYSKSDIIGKLLKFKNYWQSFDQDTRNYIKKCMIGLIKISEKYIYVI